MRIRNVIAVAFWLLVAGFCLIILFPRLHNDQDCDDPVPKDAGESAALDDARTRKAAICLASKVRCRFRITDHPDGSIQIELDRVTTDLFEGCIVDSSDFDVFVYSRDGAFIRLEEAPYG